MSQPPQPTSTTSESIRCSASDCWRALQKLRSDCPLVQCITNYVSMDIMANTLLAIGASPAMVHGELNISPLHSRMPGMKNFSVGNNCGSVRSYKCESKQQHYCIFLHRLALLKGNKIQTATVLSSAFCNPLL